MLNPYPAECPSEYKIMSRRSLLCFCTAILLICSNGCGKALPPIITLDEAGKKFRKTCSDELGRPVRVRSVDNTVWVYLPMKERILDYKSMPAMGGSPEEVSAMLSLNYVKSEYISPASDKDPGPGSTDDQGSDGGKFVVKYDISETRKYPKELGYNSIYTDAFSKAQRIIVSAIFRSYADLDMVPGDVTYADKEKDRKHKALVDAHFNRPRPPEFFVMVIADIERGIAAESIIYFEDLKQAMSVPPAIPQEEYSKRYLSRVYGLAKMIGDETGHTLDIRKMTMPEFLAKQIENRVKFKYTRSIFKPGEDAEAEIDAIVNRTLRYYGFDAAGVEVENLNDGFLPTLLGSDLPNKTKATAAPFTPCRKCIAEKVIRINNYERPEENK